MGRDHRVIAAHLVFTTPDRRNSDRRCEAPQGGAITTAEMRYSDRRCEAPQGGAITLQACQRPVRAPTLAVITLLIPPRMLKSPTTSIHAGFVASARSSRIRFTA